MKNQLLSNEIGKKIKHLRKHAGYTQERLAEMIGVSSTAVAKWENGYSEPTLQNVVHLSELFGVSSDYLLGVTATKKNMLSNMSVEAVTALKKFIFEIIKMEEK